MHPVMRIASRHKTTKSAAGPIPDLETGPALTDGTVRLGNILSMAVRILVTRCYRSPSAPISTGRLARCIALSHQDFCGL
jgi:hypothetical protein